MSIERGSDGSITISEDKSVTVIGKGLNNSDTLIIVLHEIYGINQHITSVCKHYSDIGYDVVCPELINQSQPFGYDQEEVAYQDFMNNIGFEKAALKVKTLLIQVRAQYKHIFLLGFSIGATIAWICSDENEAFDGIVGIYGSRIRDYMNVTPKCPALLVFPSEEKAFDVKKLAYQLAGNLNVEIEVLKGKHGFSDPFNNNYNEKSCIKAYQAADYFIKRIKVT